MKARSARCTFCDTVLRVHYNRIENQWVFARHGTPPVPCPGSFSFVPPGAFTDEEVTDAQDR